MVARRREACGMVKRASPNPHGLCGGFHYPTTTHHNEE